MEWTREKTLQLIVEYRCRRGLWDMTCEEYRKKDVKQRLLSEVGQALGGNIPTNELEKKFHTLRTQYHREINRMKRKEPYNSKWFGFKNLAFLSSPYACRATKGRVKIEMQSDERSSRSNALEKLIEETTKDVDEDIIEESEQEDMEVKPKLSKEINVRYVSHVLHEDEHDTIESHNQQSLMDLHGDPVEAVSFQANENGELHYQSNPATSTAAISSNAVHVLSGRIIKIPKRDPTAVGDQDGYYDEHHLHPPQVKRLYYDTSTTSHNATILESTQNGNPVVNIRLPKVSTTGNTPLLSTKVGTSSLSSPASPSVVSMAPRDEFSTYGEYVANELRAITSRESLIALKHKINTVIFEANMAEFQK
ncbi:uncharacterized protein LOC111070849 [Drosophila obscura]|uniref:uncharacterized protein LOC111070849 n=1 Tax=Drosophila obscura TaxID=7282 RepID=UPI001BB12EEE|nr:uncharacterized protein LOC111070849 [Drosophila obscura]